MWQNPAVQIKFNFNSHRKRQLRGFCCNTSQEPSVFLLLNWYNWASRGTSDLTNVKSRLGGSGWTWAARAGNNIESRSSCQSPGAIYCVEIQIILSCDISWYKDSHSVAPHCKPVYLLLVQTHMLLSYAFYQDLQCIFSIYIIVKFL